MLNKFKLTAGMRSHVIRQIQEMDLTIPKRIVITDWDGQRGLSANAISHVWYPLIGDHDGFITHDAHQLCKLNFGIPILLANEKWHEAIQDMLERTNIYMLEHKEIVNIMTLTNVTSVFTTKEMSRYLRDMQYFYGLLGLDLNNGE